MRIGFIGLGFMGKAMALRLLEVGHELVVFNRTPGKAESLVSRGAQLASTPADAAREAEVLITMVSDDAALEEVLRGPTGVIAALARDRLHISASTISPECSKHVAELHGEAGQHYVAAPVLGRPSAAKRGELVIIAAGKDDAIERARPIFDVLGKETRVVGAEPEKANVVKLATNCVLGSLLEVLGEAYALVESHGIDDTTFLAVLNDSLLKSPVVGAYGREIASDDFDPPGFRIALAAKDVRLAVETGESAAVPMPIASALRDRFVAAIAEGLANEDWAAVGRASTVRLAKSRPAAPPR